MHLIRTSSSVINHIFGVYNNKYDYRRTLTTSTTTAAAGITEKKTAMHR